MNVCSSSLYFISSFEQILMSINLSGLNKQFESFESVQSNICLLYSFYWSSGNLSIQPLRAKAKSISKRTNWSELFLVSLFLFCRCLLRFMNSVPSVSFSSSLSFSFIANNFYSDLIACAIDTISQLCIVRLKKYHKWQIVGIHGTQYFDE